MLADLEAQKIPYFAYCDGDRDAQLRLKARQADRHWGHVCASPDNRGLLAARYQAWRAFCDQPRLAQLEYLINFDPDDALAPHCAACLDLGANLGADVVEFNAWVIQGARSRRLYKGPYGAYLRYWGAGDAFMDRRMRFSVWSKQVRAPVWGQVCTRLEQICDGDLPHLVNGEDIVWTWLLSQEARSWHYLNRPIYAYRVHEQSASHRIAAPLARKKFDDIRLAHRIIRRDLAQRNPVNRTALQERLERIEIGNLHHSVSPSYSRLTRGEQSQLFCEQERKLMARAGALKPLARRFSLASYGRELQALAALVARPRLFSGPKPRTPLR